MTNPLIKQKLQEARALIEQGWLQGTSRVSHDDGTVSYCMLGAVEEVCGVNDHHKGNLNSWNKTRDLSRQVSDPLRMAISADSFGSIVMFNDKPGRPKEEVLAAFDRAIESQE